MNLLKAFRTKELGLPQALQWQYIKGVWMPYDAKDSIFIDKAYKSIPVVQSVVSKIVEKSADAIPMMYKVKDKRFAEKYFAKKKHLKSRENATELAKLRVKAFESIEQHPFLELMDRPNPTSTGRQLREEVAGYLLITGNAIVYASVPGVGLRAKQPVELWSVPSPTVKPVMSGDRRNPLAGYAITYNFENIIPNSQIAHFKYFNPVSEWQGYESTFWGLSPLRSSLNVISQKRFADVAQGSLFANMGPSGIVSGNARHADQSELTAEQAVAINDSFRQNHMGAHNAGDIVVTPSDLKWVQIGLSPVDMGILDFNQDLERQIANIYGYPSQLLTPQGTLANSETGDTRVVTNCVLPLLRKMDDVWTKMAREWYGDNTLVVISDTDVYPELEGDKKELVHWMRQAMVFSQDEIREALGYGTLVDESQVLVPTNYMPLSDMRSGDLETEMYIEEEEDIDMDTEDDENEDINEEL